MLALKFIFALVSFIHWIGLYFYVWHEIGSVDEWSEKRISVSIVYCFGSWIISSIFVFAIMGIWML